MRRELEEDLARKYPFMRRGKSFREQEAEGFVGDLYGAFGCDCGDGWYGVIDRLCARITAAYEGRGLRPDVVVWQVKEKFGTLCFYARFGGPEDAAKEASEAVLAAEEEFTRTCEVCGEPGSLSRNGPMLRTLCGRCRASDDGWRR